MESVESAREVGDQFLYKTHSYGNNIYTRRLHRGPTTYYSGTNWRDIVNSLADINRSVRQLVLLHFFPSFFGVFFRVGEWESCVHRVY